MLDEKMALQLFQTQNCAQIVLSHFAEDLGLDSLTAARIASAFGSGMERGDTCGCVAGALMALGLKYGFSEDDQLLREKKEEFERRFKEEFAQLNCRDLLGGDVRSDEDRARLDTEGTFFKRCPRYIAGAARILEDILED